MIRQWLVLGPIAVADSVKDFGKEQVPAEADLKPAEGDKVGDLAWKRFELKKLPDYERWGTTELDWIDLAEAVGYKPNQVGYAHAYLHCERPGKAAFAVDHGNGLKAWLNGKPLYEERQQAMGLGSYVGISRYKQGLTHGRSPRFEAVLQQGWNRLLVKVGSYNARGSRTFKFALRVLDAEPIRYEDKNILWATPLPERTNASPIIVGDRVFTPAEPDELICLDKRTGKVLWRRINGFFEATPEQDRAANPVFKEKIAPLAEALQQTADYEKGLELRRTIRDLLAGIDKKRYGLKWDDHLAGHFAIVGFTTTPVSDGKHVYAFFGHGVFACYDLEGKCKWIKRLEADEIRYSCSPALAGGKPLYKQDVGFDELHHYNAIGVGASPTLAGKYIYAIDNQGECVVLEAGRTLKQVAVNRIGTLLPRDWPISPQEILANAAPVFDGSRMYLRGEQYLYCTGK